MNNNCFRYQQFFWAVFVIIVLPNSIMVLFSTIFSLERPYVNVDYALVMLIILLNQRALGAIALLTVFTFDVLALTGQVFPVLRISDVLYMLQFAGMAPLAYKISGAVLCFFFLFLVFVFLLKNNRNKKLEFMLCINLVIIVYGYNSIFYNDNASQVWHNFERSPVSSQVVYAFDSRTTGFVESLSAEGDLLGNIKTASASGALYNEFPASDDQVLFIVNESWGVTSEEIQSAVLSPLSSLEVELEDWQQGTIGFNGVTVDAEIRELCQADLLHFNFVEHKSELWDCYPNKLREEGFETFAFHGAAGLMYDRVKWYPSIGFDNLVFFENHTWPRRCYSFPGACDDDMAKYVAESFNSRGKVFSYWLTLNSHHFYDSRDIHTDDFFCGDINIRSNTEICRNIKLQNQFFGTLSRIISMPHMKNVRVVVVGDHEPPISSKIEKEKYFESGRVPWVSFKISGQKTLLSDR